MQKYHQSYLKNQYQIHHRDRVKLHNQSSSENHEDWKASSLILYGYRFHHLLPVPAWSWYHIKAERHVQHPQWKAVHA